MASGTLIASVSFSDGAFVTEVTEDITNADSRTVEEILDGIIPNVPPVNQPNSIIVIPTLPEPSFIPSTSLAASNGQITANTEFYEVDSLPETVQAFLPTIPGNQDTVEYIEGELVIEMQNSPQDLSYAIDDFGNLILIIATGDEDAYSIDEYGCLIYITYE